MLLFDGPHDVERWDVRARHDELEVGHWVYSGEPADPAPEAGDESSPKARELLVILSIRRGGKIVPMHAGLAFAAGDIAAVAIHKDEREVAERVLAAAGWTASEASAAA
jgi:hypothetical protein